MAAHFLTLSMLAAGVLVSTAAAAANGSASVELVEAAGLALKDGEPVVDSDRMVHVSEAPMLLWSDERPVRQILAEFE
ncbi:MAG: hypothetical protein WA979_08320 [Pacificimonas sp.]